MANFFEIDFLDVESDKSGDAIAIRYQVNDVTYIHVVDGGFQDTGEKVVEHVRKYYGDVAFIDHVVASHPDGDHAGGLRVVLEEFAVGRLWMLRPWLYADEIVERFARYSSAEILRRRLREIYPNISVLEEIAIRRGIPIDEPFQGRLIGAFYVLAPSRGRYLDLVVESERTPEVAAQERQSRLEALRAIMGVTATKALNMVRAAWGTEVFSPESTSAENEMSIVQYSTLAGKRILLTADTGKAGLEEAADFAAQLGLVLPGIDRFQVPHHGSRRNVSTEVLDRWLGPRLPYPLPAGSERFTAIVSSAKKDESHPRRAVLRACIHRGGKVVTTEGATIRTSHNAPPRAGWVGAKLVEYPDDQEE